MVWVLSDRYRKRQNTKYQWAPFAHLDDKESIKSEPDSDCLFTDTYKHMYNVHTHTESSIIGLGG